MKIKIPERIKNWMMIKNHQIRDEKENLGNNIFRKSKRGSTVFAAIDLPFKMNNKQPTHILNYENWTQ